jgi:hypothetical protein
MMAWGRRPDSGKKDSVIFWRVLSVPKSSRRLVYGSLFNARVRELRDELLEAVILSVVTGGREHEPDVHGKGLPVASEVVEEVGCDHEFIWPSIKK